MDTGAPIVIEERPEWEACTARGKRFTASGGSGDGVKDTENDNEVLTVLVTPHGTKAWNPAFDVTPGRLIDGKPFPETKAMRCSAHADRRFTACRHRH
jgi:methylthioribose-1-phosphate isomerase